MKLIAITGSFASGKSFVSKYLQETGFNVFSCDDYVRELYNEPSIQHDLVKIIDNLATNEKKAFDKKRLIEIVYNDDNQRKILESFVHPKVKDGINDFKHKYLNDSLLFVEVPLLFEANFDSYFDHSICVYCSEETRENRARSRGVFDLRIYNKISSIQLPQEEKKKLADFLINTDVAADMVKNQVDKIIEKLNEY